MSALFSRDTFEKLYSPFAVMTHHGDNAEPMRSFPGQAFDIICDPTMTAALFTVTATAVRGLVMSPAPIVKTLAGSIVFGMIVVLPVMLASYAIQKAVDGMANPQRPYYIYTEYAGLPQDEEILQNARDQEKATRFLSDPFVKRLMVGCLAVDFMTGLPIAGLGLILLAPIWATNLRANKMLKGEWMSVREEPQWYPYPIRNRTPPPPA